MVGQLVMYTDEYSKQHYAVVTADWGGSTPEKPAALNLVYVTDDEAKTDQYGRQILRAASVVHESNQSAPGRFYSFVN